MDISTRDVIFLRFMQDIKGGKSYSVITCPNYFNLLRVSSGNYRGSFLPTGYLVRLKFFEIIFSATITLQYLNLLSLRVDESIYIENVPCQQEDRLLLFDMMLSIRSYDVQVFICVSVSENSNIGAHVRKGECQKISRTKYLRTDFLGQTPCCVSSRFLLRSSM